MTRSGQYLVLVGLTSWGAVQCGHSEGGFASPDSGNTRMIFSGARDIHGCEEAQGLDS